MERMKEFDLLNHIFGGNPALPARITIPPGDDMGAVDVGAVGSLDSAMERQVLVTVDQLIDGVHFDLKSTPLEKIARKAMTRNLSDVAAMAARPLGAVAAACFPPGFPQAWAQRLSDAMQQVAIQFDCPLFGGDVSTAQAPLSITVTVLARPDGIAPVRRAGASVGDVVFVTGALGGSLENVNGYIHHLDFEPRLALARALASRAATRPAAMLDLSDGLGRDLSHICAASGVAALLLADALPISAGAAQAASRDQKPVWQHAISDGEDYELCFTVPAQRADNIPADLLGVPITRVGVIDEAIPGRPLVRLVRPDGVEVDAGNMGWEHNR